MTHASQRLIRSLSTPEQFLISALRLWGQGRDDHGPCCCRSLLRNGFQAAGLLATEFETFDRVLTMIDAASQRGFAIEAPKEPTLSRNEERYLRALADAQANDLTQLRWALSVWLTPAAIRIAMPALLKFARACAAVGLVLPRIDAHDDTPARASVIPLRTLSAQLH